jgi:hypothetical protein
MRESKYVSLDTTFVGVELVAVWSSGVDELIAPKSPAPKETIPKKSRESSNPLIFMGL